MAIIPITLYGDNLGVRHKQLNNLVNEAFQNNVPFETIRDVPEQSAIDRLFKIDLAAKYKNVEYIVKTLKENDILYVSRAMKCDWLISDDKYINIINPTNLEQNLYPDMRTNATNKMKHWIQLRLKDENRCKDFYEYYKKDQNVYALKFLPKCPIDFLLKEIDLMSIEKINPQFLKLLCERSAKAAEVVFKNLKQSSDKSYIIKIQILLKSDPEVFFYIIENFFWPYCRRLNRKATRYIMTRHREKFDAKPELYTSRILDLSTIAYTLNSEEIQELIFKMAKASYLYEYSYEQFDYKFAKPLIKAIDPKKRSILCTKIFIHRDFGELVEEPPYFIPKTIFKNNQDEHDNLDKEIENYDKFFEKTDSLSSSCRSFALQQDCVGNVRSQLDVLYDYYRFQSFEETFAELRQCLTKESNMYMRQNMMLVLISKTGGRTESVKALLNYLLEKHLNEPINLRAAIVRSFVKRAFAWRWPDPIWENLFKYGYDLGLDGSTSEVECHEGLHAIVLRHIIADNEPPLAVWNYFLNDFRSLNHYKLKSDERRLLHERLPALVIRSAKTEKSPETSIKRLTDVCDLLESYKFKIDNYPGYMEAVTEFAQKDIILAKPLLLRLFKARIGRKLLFKENFEIVQTAASYINALRHDASLISDEKLEELIASINDLHHNAFFHKVALYFGEEGDLASRCLKLLRKKNNEEPKLKLVRPIALLSRTKVVSWSQIYLLEDKAKLKMIRSLQNNSILVWTKLPQQPNFGVFNLAGIAIWIQTCSPNALKSRMNALMVEPKHALLVLALRSSQMPGAIGMILAHAAKNRPMRALCVILRILRRSPYVYFSQDFKAILTLVSTMNLKGKSYKRYCDLARLNNIPISFRAAYALALYRNLNKLGFGPEKNIRSHPCYQIAVPLIHCLSNHIYELDPDSIKTILREFLDNVLTLDVLNERGKGTSKNEFRNFVEAFIVLIARYLITSKSDEDVKKRINEVYVPFEQRLKELWHIENLGHIDLYNYGYFEHFLLNVSSTKILLTGFSLPILHKLCYFADEIIPLNENFVSNYFVRFICLFRKAIKLGQTERPDLYKSGKVEGKHAVEFVLLCFGKTVATDVENLISIYFPSIRVLYTNALEIFLIKRRIYRIYVLDSVIQGLLSDDSKQNAVIVGLSLYEYCYGYRHDRNVKLEFLVTNVINNSKKYETKFYKGFSEVTN